MVFLSVSTLIGSSHLQTSH